MAFDCCCEVATSDIKTTFQVEDGAASGGLVVPSFQGSRKDASAALVPSLVATLVEASPLHLVVAPSARESTPFDPRHAASIG